MRPGETLIDMARRHVREAERHVEQQKALVQRLRHRGLPADDAERLLTTFEDSLDDHRAGLARMIEEQRLGQRSADGSLNVRRPFI